jgi:hypothetical protein
MNVIVTRKINIKKKKLSDFYINDDISMSHFHKKMLFFDVLFHNDLFTLLQE